MGHERVGRIASGAGTESQVIISRGIASYFFLARAVLLSIDKQGLKRMRNLALLHMQGLALVFVAACVIAITRMAMGVDYALKEPEGHRRYRICKFPMRVCVCVCWCVSVHVTRYSIRISHTDVSVVLNHMHARSLHEHVCV